MTQSEVQTGGSLTGHNECKVGYGEVLCSCAYPKGGVSGSQVGLTASSEKNGCFHGGHYSLISGGMCGTQRSANDSALTESLWVAWKEASPFTSKAPHLLDF